ncbi:hypothetical protein P3S68_009523 [Capsicum galapagoense]
MNEEYANLSRPNAKKHFVLLQHKARHGARSWHRIVALMRCSGYKVRTIDLGVLGINLKQAVAFADSPYLKPWKVLQKRFQLLYLSLL